MAIGDRLSIIAMPSSTGSIDSSTISKCTSTSSPSSSFLMGNSRYQLVHVATHNSSTFIRFPTNSRSSSYFVPTFKSRRPSLLTRVDSRAVKANESLNNSKSLKTSPSSTSSDPNKQDDPRSKVNPILNNPLLNHRKKPAQTFPANCTEITTIQLLPKPSKVKNEIPVIRTSTNRCSMHQTENTNISNRQENHERKYSDYIDKQKFDYVSHWLQNVRQATCRTDIFWKSAASKRRYVKS